MYFNMNFKIVYRFLDTQFDSCIITYTPFFVYNVIYAFFMFISRSIKGFKYLLIIKKNLTFKIAYVEIFHETSRHFNVISRISSRLVLTPNATVKKDALWQNTLANDTYNGIIIGDKF